MTQSASNLPTLSIVLGSYNRNGFLQKTIESIRSSQNLPKYEIIVVDGASTDGSLQWLIEQKDIITIVHHNRGEWLGKKIEKRSWGYFMNLAFKTAQGKFVLMVSDDCFVHSDAISEGIKFFERLLANGKKVGAVPFYWRNWPEMSNYWVGKTLGDNFFVNHGLYLKEALECVKYIDESNFQFYCADGDLCLKIIDQGYQIHPCIDSLVEHYDHLKEVNSESAKRIREDVDRYQSKWKGRFDQPKEGDWVYYTPADINFRNTTIEKTWKWLHLKSKLSKSLKIKL